MSHSTSSKILRNSTFNVLRGVIGLPIALILTPLVVRAIGLRYFGIWSLIYVFVQSASLLDLGLTSSLIKFVAELNEKKELSRLNQILSSAFFACLVLGAALVAAIWGLKATIVVTFFKATPWEQQSLEWLLIFSAGVFAIQLVTSVFTALLQGLQRLDLSNSVAVGAALFHFGLVVLAIRMGYGLWALIVAQGLSVALGGVLSWVAARRIFFPMEISIRNTSIASIRAIFPLSVAVQCLSVQTLVFYQWDKLVLSSFLGPYFAGCYEIATRPLSSLRTMPLTVVQPILPAVSELNARKDVAQIERIYRSICKYVSLSAAPVFVPLVFLAKPLLDLWFAGRPLQSQALVVVTVQLLAATYLLNVLGGTITFVALGLGDRSTVVRYSALATGIHVLLTTWMVSQYGYVGAPIAALAATLVSVGYYFMRFSRTTGIQATPILRESLLPIGIAAILSFGVFMANVAISWFAAPLHFVVLLIFYFLAYIFTVVLLGCLTTNEIHFLHQFIVSFWSETTALAAHAAHHVSRAILKIVTIPERRLKALIVRRYGSREVSDDFSLRLALLWGWGVDRIRRNLAVALKIREANADKKVLVLDVGSSEDGVRRYLPQDKFSVCSLDLDWKDLSTQESACMGVAADGCQLPFLDEAFDYVTAVDSLEHVPPDRRPAFLRELRRVARTRVVLHFPAVATEGYRGHEFDARFQKLCSKVGKSERFTEEHLMHGLPDVDLVTEYFPGCKIYGRENGPLWLLYMVLERIPYLAFLTGLLIFPFRGKLDSPPFHAVLLVFDKAQAEIV